MITWNDNPKNISRFFQSTYILTKNSKFVDFFSQQKIELRLPHKLMSGFYARHKPKRFMTYCLVMNFVWNIVVIVYVFKQVLCWNSDDSIASNTIIVVEEIGNERENYFSHCLLLLHLFPFDWIFNICMFWIFEAYWIWLKSQFYAQKHSTQFQNLYSVYQKITLFLKLQSPISVLVLQLSSKISQILFLNLNSDLESR